MIVHFKLVTGEEVVGQEMETEKLTHVVIKSPRSLVLGHVQGGMGVQMIPFLVGDPDGEIPIEPDKFVVSPKEAPKPLSDAYIQNTTNIQIATSVPGGK